MKYTDYRILADRKPEVLAENVAKYLRSNWRLHGGPIVVEKHFCQAVVKK